VEGKRRDEWALVLAQPECIGNETGRATISQMVRGGNSRQVGLARALSKLGYCSRSRAAELIREGRVRLNGATRRDPEMPTRLDRDLIEVDHRIVGAEAKLYLMLNKPRGAVTTASDEKGRETIYAYLGKKLPWVAPVGRLDKATEGLLLLTNDSEWAARISAPETHLDKTYHVQVATVADERLSAVLTNGVRTSDGELLRAKRARVLRTGGRNSWLEIALDEGKNRQIRRMLEQSGIEVLRLVRAAIGPLALGNLAKGTCRALTSEEKCELDRAMKTRHTQPLLGEKR
jgi:23S rRNA pseudouridine2605 synthase